jgi:hypothetical protein
LIVIAFRLLHEGPYQPPLLELIVNVAGAEIPEAVVTVMLAVPTLAIKLAGTLAVNCVALTNVVVSPVVPHCTVAVVVKFAPFTVNVNPGPPAVAELGLRLLIVGGGRLIENVAGAEIPEAVVMVMLAVPALAIRLAGTLAVNCVALTNVVVSSVAPHVTVAPLVKFEPFTVIVNPAPPAVAELGLRLLIVGPALLLGGPTVKKVEGELWLLYSVAIQSAERATLLTRASSKTPENFAPPV